jgi:uncharacterized protein (TIGR02147 family)
LEKQVFDFNDYRSFLLAQLGAAGKRTGLRSEACKVLGCHSTYLSQVLGGKTDLSLEYGESFNKFFHHNDSEGQYFLLLLLRDRSGSSTLKDRFQKQIDEVRKQRSSLKERNKGSGEVSLAEQEKFYTSWLYSALHVLASLPHLKTKSDLAESVGVSETRISQALEFLLKTGLLVAGKNGYEIGKQHVHLGSDSQLISKHHTNWRFHTINTLETSTTDDLHYSGAISISKSAALKIRENILAAFQENMMLVRDAKEELAYVYCFDFYRLDR